MLIVLNLFSYLIEEDKSSVMKIIKIGYVSYNGPIWLNI